MPEHTVQTEFVAWADFFAWETHLLMAASNTAAATRHTLHVSLRPTALATAPHFRFHNQQMRTLETQQNTNGVQLVQATVVPSL